MAEVPLYLLVVGALDREQQEQEDGRAVLLVVLRRVWGWEQGKGVGLGVYMVRLQVLLLHRSAVV